MFIAVEGGDGVGKTTLCSILSKKLNAISYRTPPKKYWTFRTEIDKNATVEERYRFYRDGIHDASDEIILMLKNGDKIVCDRYWLGVYTYHQVMGMLVPKEDFKSIIVPTLTVILSLNHEVQIERMLHRGLSVGDRRMLDKQKDITAAYYLNALEFNIPFILIDTQKFLPEMCSEIVIKSLDIQ